MIDRELVQLGIPFELPDLEDYDAGILVPGLLEVARIVAHALRDGRLSIPEVIRIGAAVVSLVKRARRPTAAAIR